MIVKFLSSTSSFAGVKYNSDKMELEKGELMKLKNFGYLELASNVQPSDLKNYLISYSSTNSKVKNKQLHVVLSAKGKEYDKHQLTEFAEMWLKEMGYSKNPYLVVFHSDTENNHVHIVSTRIDENGKKINDSFERVKSQKAILEILKMDPVVEVSNAKILLNEFNFRTKAQARLLLERQGFTLKEDNGFLSLIKYGQVQDKISSADIQKRIEENIGLSNLDQRIDRRKQINAILYKYSKLIKSNPLPVYEPSPKGLEKKQIGYRSDLADFLKDKFGIELVFHGKPGLKPYGYTLIDHKTKALFKGSEIFSLDKFLAPDDSKQSYTSVPGSSDAIDLIAEKVKLESALTDFSNIQEGLKYHSIEITKRGDGAFLKTHQREIPLTEFIPKEQETIIKEQLDKIQFPSINIALDVDDEAVHGRERNKKRKSNQKSSR